MKTFDEHMDNIRAKAAKLRRRRRIIITSCAGTLVLALALTLFLPFGTGLPSVVRYQNSPYYKLISGLNKATYQPPRYNNNYEKLVAALKGMSNMKGEGGLNLIVDAIPELGMPEYGMTGSAVAPGAATSDAASEVYQEVTDNQVQGVVEADIFKRSDKYLYHLYRGLLTVYSIDKEDSAAVGKFDLRGALKKDDLGMVFCDEMYLSVDCKSVSIVTRGHESGVGFYTAVTSLDVTNPEKIRLVDTVYFPGSYISSRMVDGQILLTYLYQVYSSKIDFDNPETFVPMFGKPGQMQLVDAENIVCPDEVDSTQYTVIAKLDGKTMEVLDTAALLSYSEELYVSENTIFATHTFTKQAENEKGITAIKRLTEITGIGYTGQELTVLGSVQVEGAVNDQYSMDQQGSILRLATSTWERSYEQGSDGETVWVSGVSTKRNCNLYCIDLTTWEVAASVIGFAPDGEEVVSARFDGDKAYICTAEVVIMTDPVYFFDLSDIHNITYKQTPVIDGFSSSLIQFGDYLLGIGFNEDRELKLEAYVETADGVESVAAYERSCGFSSAYKSYFIDRENQMVGLAVSDWFTGEISYLLIQFDGYQFRLMEEIPISCGLENARAALINGWLYLLHSDLTVMPIW